MPQRVLTINGGSSSIKFAVYALAEQPNKESSGEVTRIGLGESTLSFKASGDSTSRQPIDAPDYSRAIEHFISWLDEKLGLQSVVAIGHRIVHGGPTLWQSMVVDPQAIAELKRISPWDPTHLPAEIALIEAFSKRCPTLPQVACFDTAFHHALPTVARLLPLPRHLEAEGVRRYGFHGLSYTFLLQELARVAGAEAASGRVVLAHLGAGASLAAVCHGKCIDTTMSFTPTAGLVMATRCGDMDPGLLVYLMREKRLTADQIDEMVNRQSGLVGISQTTPDMRDLLSRRAADPRAAEAVEIFCYQAKKAIGAFVAALGGLDTLVFSGGIGENAAEVRRMICDSLECFGIQIDAARNASSAPVISADGSPTTIRVIRTDEESVIVSAVQRLLNER